MSNTELQNPAQVALSASWERCANTYRLQRDAASPILRLRHTEVAPRLEALIEQTGGRQGIFRQLANVAMEAGHCLVITDKDGILVRLECKGADSNWNGIALGSVWDERVAGTNGVSMALSEKRAFTVRGRDHYYAQLSNFTCSAVPLRDADNAIVGAASLSSMKANSPSDDLFGQQVLRVAADRLQTNLFLQAFKNVAIISIAVPGRRELIKEAELVAVDEAGIIVGSTGAAHQTAGLIERDALIGKPFDQVIGTDFASLDRVPGRVMSVRRDNGPMLDVWTRTPMERSHAVPGWRPQKKRATYRHAEPTLKELANGSSAMKVLCERAETSFNHGVPVLLEGETGTGKSAIIGALVGGGRKAVVVDCAALDETTENRDYFRSLMEQTRILGDLEADESATTTLVFDNVDEMPMFGQIALRSVLSDLEAGSARVAGLKVMATSRTPLRRAVENGRFRDDLFYLMSGARFVVPPLRSREQVGVLAQALSHALVGHPVEISREANAAIQAYDWPGNVRELRDALNQALLQGDGCRIGVLDLLINEPNVKAARPVRLPSLTEEQMLLEALSGARWNVSKAARALGIGRATIHRKMKAYGITRPV